MSQTELTTISGVGEATAAELWRAGLRSVADVAAAAIEDIAAVPGFGYVRAQRVRAQAKDMTKDDSAAVGAVTTLGDAPIGAAAKKAKGKKGKKSKDKKSKKDKKKDCCKGSKKKGKKKDGKKSKTGKKDRKSSGKKGKKGKKK